MDYRKMSGEEILDHFIKFVVSSDDFDSHEYNEEEYGKRPSLKIYYVESTIKPSNLKEGIYSDSDHSIKLRNLLKEYNMEIIQKKSPYVLLIFKDKKYREEHFYLIRVDNSYWEIFTLERHDIVKKTLQRALESSDKIDSVWVARDKLLNIVSDLVSDKGIHGFTSKRRTLNFKKITIKVYGGDIEDVEKARKYFYSEPVTIYFKQTNSPIDAVVGTISTEGYLRIDKIRPDSVDLFKDTKDRLWDTYKKNYSQIIDSIDKIGKTKIKFNNEFIASKYNSFYSLTFNIKDKTFWKDNRIYEAIKEKFIDNKNEYIGYKLGDPDILFIYDLYFGGLFRVRLNKKEGKVIICPDESVSKKSMSKLCSTFIEKIEHSADPEQLIEVFS